ncbi:MAG TPA: SUMF1/EgtB/PvdO family nonheme iron enzyme, partial [Steroidobacteraceae bacterium]|nr:SUMF1/EgtB/PvdO family nonheme iron enzyme [Steroidobacteraceae bacterium]
RSSVRKVEERLRVTVQLIDAPHDAHLWAERYDRRLADVFELQDEICEHVATAVTARLLDTPPATAHATAPASQPPARPAQRFATSVRSVAGLGASALLVLALAAALTWTFQRRSNERWAREEGIPQLERAIESGEALRAFDLAAEIADVIPNDPRLKALEPEYLATVTLRTAPSASKVYYRPYESTDDAWRYVGETPLEEHAMPLGLGLWKFEAPGHTPTIRAMRNPGLQLQSQRASATVVWPTQADLTVPLPLAKTAPPGMVLVPATELLVPFVTEQPVAVAAFYIDRLETTNREYKEFVDAGGYREAAYWQDLPFPAGIDWQTAVAGFVDATGRPGPSTWEAGTHADGADRLPVGGLSWYEAAAYARFRGKELPTAYHWYRAANSLEERMEAIGPAIARRSNFSSTAAIEVGTSNGIGPFGTHDMAGNVREWLWNRSGSGRWIAGGGYDQLSYMYHTQETADPLDRAPTNGVRAMRTLQGGPVVAALREQIVRERPNYSALEPSSDAVFQALARQFDYVPLDGEARVQQLVSSNPAWRREQIELPVGYEGGHFKVQLFIPATGTPPYSVVIYGPHAGYRTGLLRSDEFNATYGSGPVDFVVKSGRALAVIAFDGCFERTWSAERKASMPTAERVRLQMRHMRQDLGRTLDYLKTRSDLDATRVGWLGHSYGSAGQLPLIALETRIRAAVLNSGGIAFTGLPPDEEMYNYLPRVTQPVLMLNGRWDDLFPVESQETMFRLLGTPPEHKRHVLFEAGHAVLPVRPMMAETLDFFDRYLATAPP